MGVVDGEALAEGWVVGGAVDEPAQQVVTGVGQDADRDVQRGGVLGGGRVDEAPRQVEAVAGAELVVEEDGLGAGRLVVRAVPVERGVDQGLADRPVLRALDLEDEHVVGVVVRSRRG